MNAERRVARKLWNRFRRDAALGFLALAAAGCSSPSNSDPGGSGGATSGGNTALGGTPDPGQGGAPASGGATNGGTANGGTANGGAAAGGSAGKASTGGTGTAGSLGTGIGFGTYGQDTPAGRGGQVIKVTTLAASGAGSLAAALAVTGPRIIVFEVGGVIDLNKARLSIASPFVTIAGQTAPSPGITLIRGGMRVVTHDVKIQHIRVRMGDAGDTAPSGFEPDVTTDTAEAYNIIFDHVSVAWGVDENLSVSGPRFDGVTATSRKVTIRNSIIAEGLLNSVHEKGAHSMGTLIHDYCTDVAVVGNFYAHNDERNPWFKGFGRGVIVNNLVYNPGKWAMRLGAVLSEWTDSGITPEGPQVSVVGNVLQHGTNTPTSQVMVGSNSNGSAYVEDNLAFNVSGAVAPIVGGSVKTLTQKPAWPDGLVALPANQVVESVLTHAGARPKDRDAVDTRLIADYRAKRGSIIDSQSAVGGYPTAAMTTRALTVPADVEAWLGQMAADVE